METKDRIEFLNTLLWLFMDACWMLEFFNTALVLGVPVVVSGVFIPFLEKNPATRRIDIAVLAWIMMNATWLYSDILKMPDLLLLSRFFFGVSLFFIFSSIRHNKSLKVILPAFKRFRFRPY